MKKGKVLFIDDDKVDRMAIKQFAEKENFKYDYKICGSLEEAGRILEDNKFDAIISDYMLGSETAFDLFDIVKNTPIIIITGLGDEKIAVKAMKSGAYDYLIKDPEDSYLKTLAITIENVIKRKQVEDELKQYRNNLEELVQNRTSQLTKEIHERIQAEKALRESEEQFRTLTQTANDAIVGMDEKGKITIWNDSATRMFGYSEIEAVGNDLHSLIAPSRYYDKIIKGMTAFSKKGSGKIIGKTVELTALRKDGTEFPVGLSISLMKRGERWHSTGIIRDISERKKAEKELRIKDTAITSSINAIIITDLHGKLTYVNNAFLKIWGCRDQKDVIGKSISRFWQNEGNGLEIIKEINNKGGWIGELIAKKTDDSLFDVQVSASLITDQDGHPISQMASFIDITEHKRLEEQFRQAQKMEAVGRLAGGVAHDFNNILTVIRGYSELSLNRLNENDPIYQNIKQINESSNRAEALTRQLLAFSRRQVLQPRTINLNELIRNMEKMLGRLIGENIELTSILDPKLWNIKADPGQIEQVIMNLVINAGDAMPDGGGLILETKNLVISEDDVKLRKEVLPGSYVTLLVIDTGIGMDQETQSHIFEPFFSTKEAGKGTGLGLSMVYGIVKQSAGFINIISEPDQGTTFKIEFPCIDEAVTTYDEPEIQLSDLKGKETILVVEDQNDVRQLICGTLRLYGYKILDASQSGDALLICEQHKETIHLILTDIVMPRMSGRTLVERLSPLHSEMKVLYMSGYTDSTIANLSMTELGRQFIQKPFAPLDLVSRVREILDSN